MNLALDAMSGDFSPKNEVLAALSYLDQFPKEQISLFGDEREINDVLKCHDFDASSIEIIHCTEQVLMTDSPSEAIRKKADSSLAKSIISHANKKTNAIVSCANTGAQLAFSTRYLSKQESIIRPCIGAFLPKVNGATFLLDVGSLVDSKAVHLEQFALMANNLFNKLGITKNPRIALLNIGSEENKGNSLTKSVYPLLKKSTLNFIGNIEGHQILSDDVDIVVCDGFSGNTILKMYESILPFMTNILSKNLNNKNLQFQQSLSEISKILDYQQYGGVPVLGVNGISIVCHGKSSVLAITNALKLASKLARSNFPNLS